MNTNVKKTTYMNTVFACVAACSVLNYKELNTINYSSFNLIVHFSPHELCWGHTILCWSTLTIQTLQSLAPQLSYPLWSILPYSPTTIFQIMHSH